MPVIATTQSSVSEHSKEINALLFREDDSLVLVLRRRKNKPGGSRIARKCSCHHSVHSCVYHLLGSMLDGTRCGSRVFPGITPAAATEALRKLLAATGTENVRMYRPHDLRRGHADDLRKAGAPLWQILAAGEWRSPAFLEYMDLHRMEAQLVLDGCMDEEPESDHE